MSRIAHEHPRFRVALMTLVLVALAAAPVLAADRSARGAAQSDLRVWGGLVRVWGDLAVGSATLRLIGVDTGLGVPATETLDASTGVDELLFPGEERMALAAELEMELIDGGMCHERVAT